MNRRTELIDGSTFSFSVGLELVLETRENVGMGLCKNFVSLAGKKMASSL